MRLKLKPKQTKKKKKESTTSKNKKIDKKLKISKNYFDMSEFKADKISLSLDRLKYNAIIYCDVKSITTIDGTIELDKSWDELILLLTDTVRANHENDFIEYLMDRGITTQEFCVDKKYGRYSFDKYNYRAYNLYSSGYFVEAIFSIENIFRTLTLLVDCLGIPFKEFELQLVNKFSAENTLTKLEEQLVGVNISQSKNMFRPGVYLREISIDDKHYDVKLPEHVLMIICNYIFDNYGVEKLKSLDSNTGTGIITDDTKNEIPSMDIRDSGVKVYSNVEIDGIIKFIKDAMNKLGMTDDSVKLYFKQLKKAEDKKEWEVD